MVATNWPLSKWCCCSGAKSTARFRHLFQSSDLFSKILHSVFNRLSVILESNLQVIHFPDYFGRCGIHHLRLPRFYPAVDIIAAGDLEKWRKRNEEILFERFRCQLRMFKQQKLDKLADSLAIYVRFGRFYLNDPSCKLQETGRYW